MLLASDLRNGVVFKYEGKTWIVLRYELNKTGRGSATYKIKARDLLGNAIVEKGFSQNTTFEEATVEKRSAQYLYADDDYVNFMDNESFEQFVLTKENVEDNLKYILEGGKVIVVYLDGKPIGIEVPKSVNLKVVYAEPAIRGDTSNNPTKRAQLESGAEISVPLFIKIGDVVKVNTQDNTYSERVN